MPRYAEQLSAEHRAVLAAFMTTGDARKALLAGAEPTIEELELYGYIVRFPNGALYLANGHGRLVLGAKMRATLAELEAVIRAKGEPLPALPEPVARRRVGPVAPLPCSECEAPAGTPHARGCPRAAPTAPPRSASRRVLRPAPPPADPALPRVVTPQRPEGEAVRYVIAEAADLVTSHSAETFAPRPDYPAQVQERPYQSAREEQLKVVQGARMLDPAFLLSDTPTPVDGPPLVTWGPRRLVLGGNGRTMMLLRARASHPERFSAYIAAVHAKAPAFGLSATGFDEPVLVREVQMAAESPAVDLAAAVRRFNEGMTQALAPIARAVADARLMSADTVESIGRLLAEAGDWTLRDLLREQPREIIELLEADGIVTAQNRGAWFLGWGLTDEAKDRIEGMFLGRVVGTAARMTRTPPSVLGKVERIAAHLVRVAGANPALDEIATVQAALDLIAESRHTGLPLEAVVRQGGLFGGATSAPSEVAVDLALRIERESGRDLAARFRAWANEAARDPRQAVLFGRAPSRDEARALLTSDDTREAA